MAAIRTDLTPHRQGDTWFGLIIGPLDFAGVPQSFTGGRVLMTLRKGQRRRDVLVKQWDSEAGAIEIAEDGATATIPGQVLDVETGEWWYDIQVTLASGVVITPWYGTFEQTDDIGS